MVLSLARGLYGRLSLLQLSFVLSSSSALDFSVPPKKKFKLTKYFSLKNNMYGSMEVMDMDCLCGSVGVSYTRERYSNYVSPVRCSCMSTPYEDVDQHGVSLIETLHLQQRCGCITKVSVCIYLGVSVLMGISQSFKHKRQFTGIFKFDYSVFI